MHCLTVLTVLVEAADDHSLVALRDETKDAVAQKLESHGVQLRQRQDIHRRAMNENTL